MRPYVSRVPMSALFSRSCWWRSVSDLARSDSGQKIPIGEQLLWEPEEAWPPPESSFSSRNYFLRRLQNLDIISPFWQDRCNEKKKDTRSEERRVGKSV